jgi:hypothetical protein
MSFLPGIAHVAHKADPISLAFGEKSDPLYGALKPKAPPPAPGIPNPNDAANAAQAQMDAMRMRRGLMANIYAGGQNSAPVSGTTQLGR